MFVCVSPCVCVCMHYFACALHASVLHVGGPSVCLSACLSVCLCVCVSVCCRCVSVLDFVFPVVSICLSVRLCVRRAVPLAVDGMGESVCVCLWIRVDECECVCV